MIHAFFSNILELVFGFLYPAYASFKAVGNQNPDECTNWIMYWSVFALFICTEYVTDIMFFWFPFYYELKVAFVLWLLPMRTNGSASLYKKLVKPILERNEVQLDRCFNRIGDEGWNYLKRFWTLARTSLRNNTWMDKNIALGTLPIIAAGALVPEPIRLLAQEFDEQANEIWDESELLKDSYKRRSRDASAGTSRLSEPTERSRNRIRRTQTFPNDLNTLSRTLRDLSSSPRDTIWEH